MDRGAWRATVYGVAKSWTRLSDFHFDGFSLSNLFSFPYPLKVSPYYALRSLVHSSS